MYIMSVYTHIYIYIYRMLYHSYCSYLHMMTYIHTYIVLYINSEYVSQLCLLYFTPFIVSQPLSIGQCQEYWPPKTDVHQQ